MQGTSMAAPAVAGSVVLLREYFMKGYYPTQLPTAPYGVLELTPWQFRSQPTNHDGTLVRNDSLITLLSDNLGHHRHSVRVDAFEPTSALVKALLVHSAVAVGGPVRVVTKKTQTMEHVPPPPSVYQGHGRIKLDNVLQFAPS
uniref:Serine protease/ABC transporter B family protein tagC n=1 Tax=Lygus hesperus TaxID=30085 RepID=A0A0A9X0L2_LYGHE